MGQIQSIEELISLILRRRWLIIALTVLGMAFSAIYAKSRPEVYETAAVIQIEAAAVDNANDAASAASGAAQVLQTIEQRLTTRENLTAMIDRHGLFADLPALPIDKKILALRNSVTFQSVDSAAGQTFGQSRSISAILIFARLGDPDLAARVANDFAQGILDQSASGQRDRAEQNVAFFKEEETRIWQAITALEGDIAAYKNTNADAMPTLRDARRDELAGLDSDLRRVDQDRAALAGEKAVIEAKQTLRETDRRQLEDLSARLDVLDTQVASIAERRTAVQQALAATPEVERVLSGYDRQLRQLQDQYEVITQRMAEAETTQRLAERQQAQRFTLLERAITPEFPIGSGGRKIAMAGSVASLLGALILAFLLDLVRPVVRTAPQMQRQLGLQPVVCIPEIGTAKGRFGTAALRLIDDPKKPIFGMPRYFVIAAATTLALVITASMIGG
jgi:tyrosine-protein kinase Etk/Wzc